MPVYQPAKRATAWIGYVSLVSQADTKLMKSNPTIAAGDFKVSLDGGTLNNLATLPTVTPASGVMVKISLSAGEMTADNVTVVCIDAAGAEWCDLVFNLQPSVAQLDDLATAANLATLATYVDTEVAAIKTKTDFLPSATAGAAGGLFIAGTNAATTITTSLTTTFTGNLTGSVASVTGAVGSVTGNVGGNVTGSVGSVVAGVTVTTNSDKTGYALTSGERDASADALLNRNMAAVTVSNSRSPINALRMLRNKVSVPAGIVYAEDDATTAWSFTTTTDAGQAPVTIIDPA
jgi:hypothetical protein